jgi:branched-chain amino acid transport system substrate-binding protein
MITLPANWSSTARPARSRIVPACRAIEDIANSAKTPLLCAAPYSDENPYLFSATQPMALMVDGIVTHMKEHGTKTVGFIGFSDALGDDTLNHLTALSEKPESRSW